MAPAFLLLAASPEDTRAIGRAVAGVLRPGDVVSLTGDLGAGKTTLVQGAAEGLGVTQPVLSPTFTLIREYEGRLPIHHMDVYRLDSLQDVVDLGFDELVDGPGVVFVEWGDAIESLLPPDHLQVELDLTEDGEARRVTVSARGPSWIGRRGGLVEALRPWAHAPEDVA